jgi:signal peptidase I
MSPQPESPTPATAVRPGEDTTERPRSRLRRVTVVAGALLLMVVVRTLLVQSFYIPSGSMQPTLEPGDRILVSKLGGSSSVHRGDVVVFDGTTTFGRPDGGSAPTGLIARTLGGVASALSVGGNESDYVKRVVGMPGDRVVCCDQTGHLSINGRSVTEPYLHVGDDPSDLTFDVRVPAGRIWLMGDHRSDSADSRAHLGDPGGGMVRLEDVIGTAKVVYWPLDRVGSVAGSAELAAAPAPSGPSGQARR